MKEAGFLLGKPYKITGDVGCDVAKDPVVYGDFNKYRKPILKEEDDDR